MRKQSVERRGVRAGKSLAESFASVNVWEEDLNSIEATIEDFLWGQRQSIIKKARRSGENDQGIRRNGAT